MSRLKDEYIITSHQCKKCQWAKSYNNWVPFGEPKKPDTWYCMNEKVETITPNCACFQEPYTDEEEA